MACKRPNQFEHCKIERRLSTRDAYFRFYEFVGALPKWFRLISQEVTRRCSFPER